MRLPFVLLMLLALPFAVAAVIVAVSSVRRRHNAGHGPVPEPRHRGQADTAAVQDAAVYPEAPARKIRPARDRRADSARGSAGG